MKELKPSVIFTVLALWEYQSLHEGHLPNNIDDATDLQVVADNLLINCDVSKQLMPAIPEELIETISKTAVHEFSPVCAVVGGMLAQDILKALAAREPPIANFFTFDGNGGAGTVCRLSMS